MMRGKRPPPLEGVRVLCGEIVKLRHSFSFSEELWNASSRSSLKGPERILAKIFRVLSRKSANRRRMTGGRNAYGV